VHATRRLAAIMFADMVGSAALAQTNEQEALRLRDEQEALVRPLFAAHHGREVKSMGDGFLAEFDSALRAVQCAVDIQQRLNERNLHVGEAPIHLRIGIHLGDVEVRGADIFGDSVNVASRIEPLAAPGGICVTEPVFGQVRNKIPNRLEKMAPQSLTNIRFPFDVYRIVLPWESCESPLHDLLPTGIAILPFSNISPDSKDAYFADGLTEELITVLSQVEGLRVIARTSVMPYKSTSKGVSQIGGELRVSSILEGSVRKAGNRLRITAQLIDVRSEGHVWAQSYDRELNDIFAVQSEMATQIAAALKVRHSSGEEARIPRRTLPNPESYLEYLKGRSSMHGTFEQSVLTAVSHFERAIALDKLNAAAHAGLADVLESYGILYNVVPEADRMIAARGHATLAVELDPNLPEAHAALGTCFQSEYRHSEAEKEYTLALSLNPNYAWARHRYAELLADQNRREDSLREYAFAVQLDPLSAPILGSMISYLSWLRHLDEVEVGLSKLSRLDESRIAYHNCRIGFCYAIGAKEETLTEIDLFNKGVPGHPVADGARAWHAAWTGNGELVHRLLSSIESQPELIRPDNLIALAYALMGDMDASFVWLDRAVVHRNIVIVLWRAEPTLARVRNDPRFQDILKRMNLW
jgi:adenylate cyclase